MLRKPIKNIQKLMRDVRKSQPAQKLPLAKPKKLAATPAASLPPKPFRFSKINYFKYGAAVIMVALASFYLLHLISFKSLAVNKATIIYQELLRGKDALKQLHPQEAESAFLSASQETDRIQQKARNYGISGLANIFSAIIPNLKAIPQVLNSLAEFNQANLLITKDINYLAAHGLTLALNNGGQQIIAALENISGNLGKLISINSKIKNQASSLHNLSSAADSFINSFNNNYLDANLNLYKAREWLAAILRILKSSREQNFLVIFQNPSEIRPGGGFIGSFAYITLANGSIQNIAVDDIYNADRQLDIKMIAPKQLQSVTKNWGARDANWFFNFPTSAQKVILFLENSRLFKDRDITFMGLAGINVDVLESLLEITGPIEVPQYQMTLNAENFLREVQYEVEAGRDKKPGQNPKKILSVITPLLMEKLNNLGEAGKNLLAEKIQNHIANKDILFYFKDPALAAFAVEAGIGGEIFSAPQGFSGDYLAVVNANVASGKTDAFINQKIVLQSELNGDGTVQNHLTVTRSHSGQNEKDWWYQTENKNFIKILTPQNSHLQKIQNNSAKALANLSYEPFYLYDTDLRKIEGAEWTPELKAWIGEELDKSYFATWFNLPAGATKTLELNYKNLNKISLKGNEIYQFIFDKQSGVNGSLEYSITAPFGFVWKESNSHIFRFQTENPKAREMINLTLIQS